MRKPLWGRSDAGTVATEALVAPVPSVAGWTFEGTRLAGRVPFRMQRELATLLHGVAVGADTAYTYARAAELLDAIGEQGQAHAVCEAWFRLPAAQRGSSRTAPVERSLARRRQRLRVRLAA